MLVPVVQIWLFRSEDMVVPVVQIWLFRSEGKVVPVVQIWLFRSEGMVVPVAQFWLFRGEEMVVLALGFRPGCVKVNTVRPAGLWPSVPKLETGLLNCRTCQPEE